MIAPTGREDCGRTGMLTRSTQKLILRDQWATDQGISFGGVFAWALQDFPRLHINCVVCVGGSEVGEQEVKETWV